MKLHHLQLALILLGLFTFSSCFRFRISDSKAHRLYDPLNKNFKINRYVIADSTMRYLEIGDDTLPTVVFVHGALGTSYTFKKYFRDSILLKKYHMIAVDRYGHGYSDFNNTETSVKRQAEMIFPILKMLRNKNNQPIILVGYSYGGTVASRIAMDYPAYADALVLAAPAIDPQNEKKFWWNKPMDWWGIKWMMPKNFIIANDEKLAHAEECRKMVPYWHKITIPTVYIHGRNDGIVPFINHRFARKMLKNAPSQFILRDTLPHVEFEENPIVLRDAIIDIERHSKKKKSIFKRKHDTRKPSFLKQVMTKLKD